MELVYTVKRSDTRRRLTITIERDRQVIVHAPSTTSDETIKRVVEGKKQWIFDKTRHPQKYKALPHPPGKEMVNGESAPYLGRLFRIEVVDDDSQEVRFSNRFFIPEMLAAKGKFALRDWYMVRAQEKILPRVRECSKMLGVTTNQIKIVDNRYRWGSCTVKDNVNFNWRLVTAPTFVIDYVIIHELAHLIESNHTPRFWNIVRTHVPKMDKARLWLTEHGQTLLEEM